jgi:hypothetical protein
MEASTVIVSYVATDVCVVDGRLVVGGGGGGGGRGPAVSEGLVDERSD